MKATFSIFTAFFLSAASLFSADSLDTLLKRFVRKPTGALSGDVLAQAIAEKRIPDANQCVQGAILELLGKKDNPRLPTARLKEIVCLSDTCHLLMFLQEATPQLRNALAADTAFLKWFFKCSDRRDGFIDALDMKYDRPGAVLDIIHTLYKHDSKNRDDAWPLILAMALVWDTERPPLHDQIGDNTLPFSPDIEKRYDFFSDILLSASAPYPLEKLSIPAISFIVDTPVPVSELKWAQENIRERDPEKIYQSIKYDFKRLSTATDATTYADDSTVEAKKSAISWHKGPYSLANIQKQGGICTDQAYFTTMVLRARGIPSMIFCGVGKSGGHAWVAYLKNKSTWNTDVGRYKDKNFVTGISRNPMTNVIFDDHRLPLVCAKITPAASRSKDTDALTRLAKLLTAMEMPKAAQQAGELAIKADQTNLDAWVALLNAQTDIQKCKGIFNRLSEAFKDYPDIVTNMRLQQAEVLRKHGKGKQADAILENLPAQPKKRTDLSRQVSLAQVEAAIKKNDVKKARELYEEYLVAQKKDGIQILEDALRYLAFTQESNQTAEAVTFINSFVKTIRRPMEKILKNSADNTYKDWDIKLLIKAYDNNHDTAKVKKLMKKLK